MNILDLPDCMLEQIFEYFSYDEIARHRLISRRFDKICQLLLNRGFSKMIRRHGINFKRIKSLLPRRESERRNHPMARHADILTCMETRISMLSMTYTKYMELNLCCFIPGKVIDEVNRILETIETTNKPLRAHEVLQELRDISSMAIEHFDEKIAHLLKKCFMELTQRKYTPGSNTSTPRSSCENTKSPSHFMFGVSNLDDALAHTRSHTSLGISSQNMQRSCGTTYRCNEVGTKIQKMTQKYKIAIKKINRIIHIQNKQARQLRENAVAMSEMNAQIVELKRRFEIIKPNQNVDSSGMSSSIEDVSCTGRTGNIINESSAGKKIKKIRTATMILKRRIDEKKSYEVLEDMAEPPLKISKTE